MGDVYAGISISAKAKNFKLSKDRRGFAIELSDDNDKKLGTLFIGKAGIAWKTKGKRGSTTRTVPFTELATALA
jgi:hypothetical protein